MKRIGKTFLVLGSFVLLASVAFPKSTPAPAAPAVSDFERIKQLAGIWQGTAKTGKEKKQDSTVVYQITAGGNAVTETLFAGTPHEMVSVYYDHGGKLAMTHYCMLPNRPVMEVKKSTSKQIDLEMNTAVSGIAPADHHMHALSLTWKGPDKLTQKWSSFKDNKPEHATVVTLSRVK